VITFTLSAKDIENDQPILFGVALVRRMRNAGVPVLASKGDLYPVGVTRGSLTTTYDDMFDELTISWSE